MNKIKKSEVCLYLPLIKEILAELLNNIIDMDKEIFKGYTDLVNFSRRRIYLLGECWSDIGNPEFIKSNRHVNWKIDIVSYKQMDIGGYNYVDLDSDEIWDILKNDLPKIQSDLKNIVYPEKTEMGKLYAP